MLVGMKGGGECVGGWVGECGGECVGGCEGRRGSVLMGV